ncbi:MAG: Glycogen synthase [Anaerolineae bacterium]|nr:Glycogen synthase [Anaerolineae bacterium]
MKKLRVAMPAWEIGRVGSGLGTKIGGLGVIVEELPPELVKAAAQQDIELEIETLSPCFAHYDRSQLTQLDMKIPVTIGGHAFYFEVYQHIFPDGQKVVYFWDEWQLSWTSASAIYPSDPQMALTLYAAVNQAMAGYIKQRNFDTIHLHDYHVGLVPFYLGDDYLQNVPVHFTIHNATYQGITPLIDGGFSSLDRINLPGWTLFHKYFDFFDNLNLMKACLLKVYETGGKITTVSGDIAGTWGYAAELKMNHDQVWGQAYAQKGSPPGEVFVPNRHLDLFEKLPVAGITNGMSDVNRAENLPWLKASVLQDIQKKRGPDNPIFKNPFTQAEMLSKDHNFTADNLDVKAELKRLLHLEVFGSEPVWDPILITAVGRLVAQKNLGLAADIIERVLNYDGGTKFVILASAPEDEADGKAAEAHFFSLAARYPDRVYFNNGFNLPLSKLIFAGGDFSLIPSRFEPCGLVDYEASLVGNVVIGRATGGLTKVRHCAYLYDWLDVSDRYGEANAFFWQVKAAIDTYRLNPTHHTYLVQTAMNIDASWDKSAAKYIEMYRYGFLTKQWLAARQRLLTDFGATLGDDRQLFSEFFLPGHGEYADPFDWALRHTLDKS